MKVSGAIRLFATILHLAGLSTLAAPANVLLLIADDYGVDSSSLYNSTTGASLPPTPNIAALAQSGVVFQHAYANPVCSPTRACLITGRHSFRTGVGDVIEGTSAPSLTAAEFTLPDAFAANSSLGYQLAHFGKWHLASGPNAPHNIGGWPHFAGSLVGGLASYTNWTKTVNGVSTQNHSNYATTDLVNDAIAWIQSRGSQPWFVWAAFNAPHTPFHKPPSQLCPHYAALSGTQQNINANPRAYYEAAVEAMDTEIGRLIAAINRTNTHIIFLGDNGTPRQVLQAPYPSGRGKDTLYESGIRVPFIMAGPGVVNPGRTNNSPIHVVDVFSTVLELAGINVTSTVPSGVVLDSSSLLPILRNEPSNRPFAFAESFDNANPTATKGRALRNDRFKLIAFDDGRREFYDLAIDPYENTNLLSAALTAEQTSNLHQLTLRMADYQSNLATMTITGFSRTSSAFAITAPWTSGVTHTLWHASSPGGTPWEPVSNVTAVTNGLTTITLTDGGPTSATRFYRLSTWTPIH